MYKERPAGQRVDQLASNVLCGWVITGPEFDSWSTAVRNSSRATSEPPAFDTLTAQLLDENIYRSTTEAASVALLPRACNLQKASRTADPPKHKCKHCGYNHSDDSCYHKYPEKAPPGWKRKSPKAAKEEKNNNTADKPSFDSDKHGLNFMSLGYGTYENGNPEHRANLRDWRNRFICQAKRKRSSENHPPQRTSCSFSYHKPDFHISASSKRSVLAHRYAYTSSLPRLINSLRSVNK